MKHILRISLFLFCIVSVNAYAKTLDIDGKLEISPENESLIPVVAKSEGWVETLPETPEDFVCQNLKNHITLYITSQVDQAHRYYFGESRKDERIALNERLKTAFTLTCKFSEN